MRRYFLQALVWFRFCLGMPITMIGCAGFILSVLVARFGALVIDGDRGERLLTEALLGRSTLV